VSVGFVFVVCDSVVAVDRLVMCDSMNECLDDRDAYVRADLVLQSLLQVLHA
jgi:hypothetical protein